MRCGTAISDPRAVTRTHAQVDAWAVGILCYELLVGYPPFEQESRAATYEYIMYKEPKFPGWMTEDARKFISLALCKVRAMKRGRHRLTYPS